MQATRYPCGSEQRILDWTVVVDEVFEEAQYFGGASWVVVKQIHQAVRPTLWKGFAGSNKKPSLEFRYPEFITSIVDLAGLSSQ